MCHPLPQALSAQNQDLPTLLLLSPHLLPLLNLVALHWVPQTLIFVDILFHFMLFATFPTTHALFY